MINVVEIQNVYSQHLFFGRRIGMIKPPVQLGVEKKSYRKGMRLLC